MVLGRCWPEKSKPSWLILHVRATIHSGPFIPISVVWSTWPLHLEIIDTSSSYVLTSESVLSLFVANIDYITCAGNMGRSLQTKTSVFLSADAGLSWHQVRYRNTVKTELINCRDLSVFSPESRIRIRFLRILIRIQSTVESTWIRIQATYFLTLPEMLNTFFTTAECLII